MGDAIVGFRAVVILAALSGSAPAQAPSPDRSMPTFGTTVVSNAGFRGSIYFLRPDVKKLPNFKKMKPVGAIYTTRLNVEPTDFSAGFPGVTNRFEWFAIDYQGRFWLDAPGRYYFALLSDDGSKLYVDGKEVIDNDGVHGPKRMQGSLAMKSGVHGIRVEYFQGPRYHVALQLSVAGPEERWRVFDMEEFRPPQNPADSEYVEPARDAVPAGKKK